jgi:hypothetical protein
MSNRTKPDDDPRAAERAQATAAHEPDRAATAEEAAKADELELDPDVAEHEQEMAERGKHQEGEGRIP